MNRKDQTALQEMQDYLTRGTAVLTAGEIHPDLPTIHDVGPGRRINTPEPKHLGFGMFKAGDYGFDGGGAMQRSETFSWCPFTGPEIESTGYDLQAAQAAVRDLLEGLEGA